MIVRGREKGYNVCVGKESCQGGEQMDGKVPDGKRRDIQNGSEGKMRLEGGLSYEMIIKYRSVWMGAAILWVFFFHAEFYIPHMGNITAMGYGGVDIFLWASGIGCYHSLKRDGSAISFLRRRIARVVPVYWIFMVMWLLYTYRVTGITFQEILGNLLCWGYIGGLGNQFNWYMSALWITYLLAPLCFQYVEKYSDSRFKIYVPCIFLLLISFIFINNNYLIVIVSRLPLFYLGMVFAGRGTRMKRISYTMLAVLSLLTVPGFVILRYCMKNLTPYLWGYGLFWYPFLLITPGLCCLLSLAAHYVKGPGWLLAVVGKYSFEIYLLHITFIEIFKRFGGQFYANSQGAACVILLVSVGIGTAVLRLLAKACGKVIRAFSRDGRRSGTEAV